MEAKAVLRTARISPQKARLVADQVRGLPAARALDLLKFSDKKAAAMIHKLLWSAVSNAENNAGADADALKVKTIMVDEGPTLKRFMARAKGRGTRILKRTSHITIERPAKSARVTIHTARPGVVIGKRGEDIEKLRKEVSDMMGVPAHINVSEVRKPELDAQLVAESIAQQLERRIMFRRAMKRAVGNAMRLGALGIKVNVAGRLNGAEIARSEWYREGRVPLHTLRADIDYGFAEAHTTYGVIGIKVWIYKGEIFDFAQVGQEKNEEPRNERSERPARGPRQPRAEREARG